MAASSFDICVFLGPSLPLETAKALLPQAAFFPPLACGHLLQVLRLKPKVILVIDGYFERMAAVWHKEILYALSKGITVYGASSMGALRASELGRFGMKGIGKIFEAYERGEIKDDDEVTVLHKDSSHGYAPVTQAMIDIRFSVEKALHENIIHDSLATQIIDTAKALFYQERTLDKICANLQGSQVAHFKSWYESDKNTSQKAEDAKIALQLIKHEVKVEPLTFELSHTAHLNAISCHISSQPFWVYKEILPIQEKVACFSRLLDHHYLMVKRISRLLAIVYSLAKKENQVSEHDSLFGKEKHAYDANWKKLHDCEDEPLFDRLRYLKKAVDRYQKNNGHFAMICLLILGGEYEALKKELSVENLSSDEIREKIVARLKETQPEIYQVLYYTEQLWHVIEHQADKEEVDFSEEAYQEKIQFFLFQHQIEDEKAYVAWLKKFDLLEEDFKKLVLMAYRFDYIVKSNNVDIIGAYDRDEPHFWLLDALYLTGFYPKAKALLHDPIAAKKAAQAVLESAKKKGGDVYLQRLDFDLGQIDFAAFMKEAGIILA